MSLFPISRSFQNSKPSYKWILILLPFYSSHKTIWQKSLFFQIIFSLFFCLADVEEETCVNHLFSLNVTLFLMYFKYFISNSMLLQWNFEILTYSILIIMGAQYQCDKNNFVSKILLTLNSSELCLSNSNLTEAIWFKEFLKLLGRFTLFSFSYWSWFRTLNIHKCN